MMFQWENELCSNRHELKLPNPDGLGKDILCGLVIENIECGVDGFVAFDKDGRELGVKKSLAAAQGVVMAAFTAPLAPKKMLTVKQVAERLQRQPKVVQGLIKSGRLKASNIGSKLKPSYMITSEEFERFLEAAS